MSPQRQSGRRIWSGSYGSVTAVDGIDLEVAERRDLRVPRTERSGEVHGHPDALHPPAPVRGKAVVAGYDVVEHPQEVRLRIGVALQEAALDDRQTGRELLSSAGQALRAEVHGDPPASTRFSTWSTSGLRSTA